MSRVGSLQRAFLTFPFILFVPLQIGCVVLSVFLRAVGRDQTSLKGLALIFFLWIVGAFFTALVLNAVSLLNDSTLFLTASYWLAAISLMPLKVSVLDESISRLLRSKITWIAIAVGIIGLAPLALSRSNSPFPYVPAYDQFDYSRQIIAMINGHGEYVPILPVLNPLIALVSVVFASPPMDLFWAIPFLQYPVMSGAVFVLSYRLFRNGSISVLAALLVVWFDAWGQVNMLYLVFPKIMIYLSFPILLYLVDVSSTHTNMPLKKRVLPLLFAPFIFLTLSYPAIYVALADRLTASYLLTPFYAFFISEGSRFIASPISLYLQSFFALGIATIVGVVPLLHYSSSIPRSASVVYLVSSFYALAVHPEMGLVVVAFAILLLLGRSALQTVGRFGAPIIAGLLAIGVLYYFQKAFGALGSVGTSFVGLVEWIPLRISLSGVEIYRFSFSTSVKVWQQAIGGIPTLVGFLGIIASSLERHNRRPIFLPSVLLISIFLFLLPWPFSFRMTYYATPILAIFIGVIASSTLLNKRKVLNDPATERTARKISSAALETGAKAIWIVLILWLVLSPLVASNYDFLKYLNSNYSQSGIITTFTSDDYNAASWIQAHFGKEPIILTDPMTLKIVTGINGLDYSTNAREPTSRWGSDPIATLESNSIKNLIANFTYAALGKIIALYLAYDRLLYGVPHNHNVIFIVNWRTSSWVKGQDPSFARPFRQFAGLHLLLTTAGIWLSDLIRPNYYIFAVNLPSPTG